MPDPLVACGKIFGMALLITLVATPIVRVIAEKIGAIDHPGKTKPHARPTPRLGGVAVFLGFTAPLLYNADLLADKQLGILLGGALVIAIGLVDDIWGLPATIKLLLLLGITCLLSRYGIILTLFHNYYLNLLFTLIWITGVVSAFNASDTMDGLASGLAFIAGLAYMLVAVQTCQWGWGLLACALMGSTLAFLRYNYNGANIFLGDSGSFFLGYILAAIGIMGEWSTHPIKAVIIPILILGVIILDFLYTIIIRFLKGTTHTIKEAIIYHGVDHLPHRLVAIGLSRREAVLLIYLISLVISIGAVTLRNSRPIDALLLLLQLFLIFTVIVKLVDLKRAGTGHVPGLLGTKKETLRKHP
ncbi:MAG TPA: MraY family glycosyltransferase [Candidatus Brocadiales bacterium]|nr:MraY family glycosyltransferase [Candidatus Brocadiales bacterium]